MTQKSSWNGGDDDESDRPHKGGLVSGVHADARCFVLNDCGEHGGSHGTANVLEHSRGRCGLCN